MSSTTGSHFQPKPWLSQPLRGVSLAMAFVFVWTNILFAQRANPSFWEERRKNIEARGLGLGASNKTRDKLASSTKHLAPALLAQLPALQTQFTTVGNGLKPFPTKDLGRQKPLAPAVKSLSLLVPSPKPLAPVLSSIAPYADIKEVYTPSLAPSHVGNGLKPFPTVFIIQDVHQHYEAQKNISLIIQNIVEAQRNRSPKTEDRKAKTDVNFRTSDLGHRSSVIVGLEGAVGPFDFSSYRTFSEKKLVKDIADFFVQNGMIGGPEFYGITAPENQIVEMIGVEDEKLYLDNIQAFKDSLPVEKQVKAEVEKRQVEVKVKKEKGFKPELLELDKKREAYTENKFGLGDYLTFLKNTITTPNELGNYKQHNAMTQKRYTAMNVSYLVEAYHIEKTLDITKLEKERAEILEVLSKKLAKPTLDELLNSALAYRTGSITYAQFYVYFKQVSRSADVNFSQFPEMNKYVRYVQLADGIDKNKLFTEIQQLENAIENKLAITPEEKEILQYSKYLELTKKLVEFSLTPEEWGQYKIQAQSNSNAVIASVTKQSQVSSDREIASADNSQPRNDGMNLSLLPFEQFYETALQRNRVLVENLLGQVKNETDKVRHDSNSVFISTFTCRTLPHPSTCRFSVLVAGGFHTQGITQLLKQKNIPYVVLSPNITKVEEGQKSLEFLAQSKTPLEKLFAGEKIFLVAPLKAGITKKLSDGYDAASQALKFTFMAIYLALSRNRKQALAETDKDTTQQIEAGEEKDYGLFKKIIFKLTVRLSPEKSRTVRIAVIIFKAPNTLVENLPTYKKEVLNKLKEVFRFSKVGGEAGASGLIGIEQPGLGQTAFYGAKAFVQKHVSVTGQTLKQFALRAANLIGKNISFKYIGYFLFLILGLQASSIVNTEQSPMDSEELSRVKDEIRNRWGLILKDKWEALDDITGLKEKLIDAMAGDRPASEKLLDFFSRLDEKILYYTVRINQDEFVAFVNRAIQTPVFINYLGKLSKFRFIDQLVNQLRIFDFNLNNINLNVPALLALNKSDSRLKIFRYLSLIYLRIAYLKTRSGIRNVISKVLLPLRSRLNQKRELQRLDRELDRLIYQMETLRELQGEFLTLYNAGKTMSAYTKSNDQYFGFGYDYNVVLLSPVGQMESLQNVLVKRDLTKVKQALLLIRQYMPDYYLIKVKEGLDFVEKFIVAFEDELDSTTMVENLQVMHKFGDILFKDMPMRDFFSLLNMSPERMLNVINKFGKLGLRELGEFFVTKTGNWDLELEALLSLSDTELEQIASGFGQLNGVLKMQYMHLILSMLGYATLNETRKQIIFINTERLKEWQNNNEDDFMDIPGIYDALRTANMSDNAILLVLDILQRHDVSAVVAFDVLASENILADGQFEPFKVFLNGSTSYFNKAKMATLISEWAIVRKFSSDTTTAILDEKIKQFNDGEIGWKTLNREVSEIVQSIEKELLGKIIEITIPQEILENQPLMHKLMILVSLYYSIKNAYDSDETEQMQERVQAVLARFIASGGNTAVLARYILSGIDENREEMNKLINAGYKAELWDKGVEVIGLANADMSEEAKEEQRIRHTQQILEIARNMGLLTDREVSTIKLKTFDAAYNFVQQSIYSKRSKALKKITTEEYEQYEAYLENILRQFSRLEISLEGTGKEEEVTIVIRKNFIEESNAGDGVPGCFNPKSGIHRGMPVLHALEANAFFAIAYDSQGRMIANAVIALTDKGVVVFGDYNRSALNLDPLWTEAWKELAKMSPAIIVPRTSAGRQTSEELGEQDQVSAVKRSTIWKDLYFDFGEVDSDGNTSFNLPDAIVMTQETIERNGGYIVSEKIQQGVEKRRKEKTAKKERVLEEKSRLID